jgi:hypothetical protein
MKKSDIVKTLKASGLKVNQKMTKAQLRSLGKASGFWQDAWDVVKKTANHLKDTVVSTVKKAKPLSNTVRAITTLAAPLANEFLPGVGPLGVEYVGNKAADYLSNRWGVGKAGAKMYKIKVPKLKTLGKKKKAGAINSNLLP